MNKINQRGFAAVEGLMIVLVIVVLGAAGYFVWRQDHKTAVPVTLSSLSNSGTKQSKTDKSTTATSSTAETKDLALKYSGLKLSYDSSIWDVQDDESSINPQCGKQDNATLDYAHSSFSLVISLGSSCGKGGGICFDEPGGGCIAQTKEMSAVKLSASKTAYVVLHRTSTDNGKTWSYDVDLSDTKTCDALCTFTAANVQSNPSTVTGLYQGEGQLPGNPQTLDAFAALPEVKAAVSVLETAHY